MQALQPKISGTRDYVGHEAAALRLAREAIERVLNAYAYVPVDPPVLERSAPFLDRSGEDIRRRMYIFADPGGREICLRPEITIPACRAYLRQLQASDPKAQLSPDREARLCYVGPVFRYESTGEGRYRQFYQAGAEFIGAKRREAADAEVLALALEAVEASGLTEPRAEVGDLGILHAFIDGLPLADRPKTRLRRLALRNRKETRFLSAVAAREVSEPSGGTDLGDLAELLSSVEPDKAERLIRQVLAIADVRHVGGRTPEEIVERLMSRTAQRSAETVSAELTQGILALLSIKDEPAAAFGKVRDHFRSFGIPAADPLLEVCEARQRLFAAYRQRHVKTEFNVGLRRGLEYYTGFVFKIYPPDRTQVGHVCGGGRYDNLLEALGANVSIPAVGLAVGLDRLLVALQKAGELPAADLPGPQALVVAAGSVGHEDCVRTSVALRAAGWSVETDSSDRRARSALGYALKRDIPYIVFVGEDELKTQQVRIKRLSDHVDQTVALSALAAFVREESRRTVPERVA